MRCEEFARMCYENRPQDELLPDGTPAQKALKILVEHFLGEFVINYSGSVEQWNSEAVYEILRQYPEGKLYTVPKSKRRKSK